MNNFQSFFICLFIVFLLYYFVIRPIGAIGDLPNCIDRLTKEIEELKEVLKKNNK